MGVIIVAIPSKLRRAESDFNIEFIQKPFTLLALARKVRDVLD